MLGDEHHRAPIVSRCPPRARGNHAGLPVLRDNSLVEARPRLRGGPRGGMASQRAAGLPLRLRSSAARRLHRGGRKPCAVRYSVAIRLNASGRVISGAPIRGPTSADHLSTASIRGGGTRTLRGTASTLGRPVFFLTSETLDDISYRCQKVRAKARVAPLAKALTTTRDRRRST
mgnify:FL=1